MVPCLFLSESFSIPNVRYKNKCKYRIFRTCLNIQTNFFLICCFHFLFSEQDYLHISLTILFVATLSMYYNSILKINLNKYFLCKKKIEVANLQNKNAYFYSILKYIREKKIIITAMCKEIVKSLILGK